MKKVILPKDDRRCGWFCGLSSPTFFKPLVSDTSANVTVVGAGFVGLAAAREYALCNPNAKVVLIDALRVGQGASGRNSGFLIDLPHKRDLEIDDLSKKESIYALNLEAIADLKSLVHEYHIDCDWNESGKYQVAVGERGEKFLDAYRKLLINFNYDFSDVSKNELSKVLGTSYYSKAIYTGNTVLLNPAELVRGLAGNMPENVQVYEDTPALGIKRKLGGFDVETQDGVISTSQIILANSIFVKEFGHLRNRMIPTMTYASMTAPLTKDQMKIFKLKKAWGATPADHAGTTMRLTGDGRLLIRNHYNHVPNYHDDFNRRAIKERHLAGLLERYPSFIGLKIEYTWGGACSLSRNYEPFFGELEKNVFYSGIHQSVGATRGTITGKLLAHLALKQDSSSLASMLNVTANPAINPPEIIMNIGVKARMAYARYEAKSEL